MPKPEVVFDRFDKTYSVVDYIHGRPSEDYPPMVIAKFDSEDMAQKFVDILRKPEAK